MAEPACRVLPCPPVARFSLRLRADIPAALPGLDLPINRCSQDSGRIAARLGPDEWLLIGPPSDAAAMAAEVAGVLGNRFHALVDIGHRDAAFAVGGPRARDCLNAGCPLDLDDAAFPAGAATRTLLGKAEIVLIRPGAALDYRVECWRSFAPYVRAFLEQAAREFHSEEALRHG